MKNAGVLTFIIGAAVGVTAGLYLNSENGKKLALKQQRSLAKWKRILKTR